MKRTTFNTRAFTLIELLTVVAVISILGCLLLPAMAHTRNHSYDAGCLSGLRQMMTGWAMYKDENNDNLLPNAPAGTSGWISSSSTEDWHNASANTNTLSYLNGLLAPYINYRIESYRCPADVIPSDNGTRLRSRSMNGQVAASGLFYNVGWRVYTKGSDLTCPQPKDLWVYADESMYSLNDGYLQENMSSPDYPDVPANYHDGGCGFSFGDGHAEIHKWQWSLALGSGLVNVPYRYGIIGGGAHWPGSVQDFDWKWLQAHSACKN